MKAHFRLVQSIELSSHNVIYICIYAEFKNIPNVCLKAFSPLQMKIE